MTSHLRFASLLAATLAFGFTALPSAHAADTDAVPGSMHGKPSGAMTPDTMSKDDMMMGNMTPEEMKKQKHDTSGAMHGKPTSAEPADAMSKDMTEEEMTKEKMMKHEMDKKSGGMSN